MTFPENRIVVCGAGLAGCVIARNIARAGINVTVIERNKYAEVGRRFSDLVERKALKEAGFKLPWVDPKVSIGVNVGPMVKGPGSTRELFEQLAPSVMKIWSPSFACQKSICWDYVQTDHRVLNQLLLEQALDAGAQVLCEYEVTDLNVIGLGGLERVNVMGIRVKNLANGQQFDVPADITIDASGIAAFLRERLPSSSGLNERFPESDVLRIYRTIRNVDATVSMDDGLQEHIYYGFDGERLWVHLYNPSTVEIGASIKSDLDSASPKLIVDNYIMKHPSISAKELGQESGNAFIGRPPFNLVTNGFLSIGDAAGLSTPTTGYGVGNALSSAKIAAEIIIQAINQKRNDIAALWPYNWKWFARSKRGANCAALSVLERTIRSLTNQEIAFLFKEDILNTDTLEPALNGTFYAPGLQDKLKILMKGLIHPGLLARLNNALILGKKLFAHYLKYPREWNPSAYIEWCAKAEKLYEKRGY